MVTLSTGFTLELEGSTLTDERAGGDVADEHPGSDANEQASRKCQAGDARAFSRLF